MALSDQLLRLSNQVKELETSADALRANDSEHVKDRKQKLKRTIDSERAELGAKVNDANDTAAAEWARQKIVVSNKFEEMRSKAADRHAQWSERRAVHAADVAEDDALEEIDFALYSIQEAEYSILDAASARAEADELTGAE